MSRDTSADRLHAESEARGLFSPGLVKELQEIKSGRVVLATLLIWLQLTGAWAAALIGPPVLWLPAFVVICACISAMQLWVHESSHYTLFRNRRFNDLWATLFYASPIGMSVKTYRRYHMTHHARLATPTDMDRFAFNVDIRGRRLLTLLLRGLLCIDGIAIVLKKYAGAGRANADGGRDWSMLATFGWNLLLLGACIWAGRWYLYLLLWAYPILGVAVTINSLRSIGEHQPVGFAGPVPDTRDITPISRTTVPGPLEKWLMFQSNFNYHLEHHLYPTVPAANLPAAHRHLVDAGFYRNHPECLQTSGVAKVFELSRGISAERA